MNYKYLTRLGLAVCFGFVLALPVQAVEEVPDGSFEDFDDTWQCDDNCIGPVTDYIIFSSYAVEGVAYAYIFHDVGIYQDLTVPTDVSGITFWYDNQPDDLISEVGEFTVSLTDLETNEVYVQETFSEQSDIWIEGLINVPGDATGKSVRLQFSNTGGFNRIDALEFSNTPESIYATVKLKVRSHKGKPVKNANVYIKSGGTKINLLNLNTEKTVKALKTNKKGKVPKFLILQKIDDGKSVKLCVKKKKIFECTAVSPEGGVETSYTFAFDSKKVK